MSAHQQRKGARAETEAWRLLEERGYRLVRGERGRSVEDPYGRDPHGRLVSVEVKNHARPDFAAARHQAREQARRRGCDWLLLVRIPGHAATFIVEGSGLAPTIWRPDDDSRDLGATGKAACQTCRGTTFIANPAAVTS